MFASSLIISVSLYTLFAGKYSVECVAACHSEELCDEESTKILHFVQNDTRFTKLFHLFNHTHKN
jgi:hypothetical protein